MENNVITPNEYIAIVKRRKWSLILPMLMVCSLAIAVALILPPVYKSSSTILIEEQEIPTEFVATTVTSFVEQRLQSINQRIMSTTKLMEIINRYNLYQDLKNKKTTEEIVDKMRSDVNLTPISTEVMDRRTGRPSTATIAFTLSYEGKDSPDKVQQVVNVITSLFLEENLKVRRHKARETSEFLEEELQKVKQNLTDIEAQISHFKEANINSLPELLEGNIQSLNRIEQSIELNKEKLSHLKEREGALQAQLAGIKLENADKRRLEELKVNLVHLKSRFSDQYPDVKKTKLEIQELEKRLDSTPEKATDNPAYVTISSQLATTQSEIASTTQQIKDLERIQGEYQGRVDATPKVEKDYRVLMIERNSTQLKYEDLMRKHQDAKVSQGLEQEQKGERFTLIEPAQLPEKPFKPNRLAIVLIGVVLGMATGVGFASFRELTDQSVRSPDKLTQATQFPVLVTIPTIVTHMDMVQRRNRRIISAVAGVLMICAALACFHYFIMDFDILWAKISRKFL